jgi:WD40 repeat protein
MGCLEGAELLMLDGHTSTVWSVAFSSDGTRIVSASSDRSVRIWDASTGAELKRLNGHTDFVCSVAFSSDGTRIVSGSKDKSVRVWALEDDGRHWIVTSQNWIVSPGNQDRLMWVPPEIGDVLHHPHCILVLSCNGSATVDFSRSKIGTEWAGYYTPQLEIIRTAASVANIK